MHPAHHQSIALAKKGVDSVLTYHSRKDDADSAVQEIEDLGGHATALQLNTGDVASFPAFVTQLKSALQTAWHRDTFDFLVNNAGTGVYASIAETSESDFDHLVDVHFEGVFFLTQKLLPVIADGGRIVNLSSGLARFCLPGYAAYASMKGAIKIFTRYLAQELGPRGIAVNTVAPGAMKTDFGGGAVSDNSNLNKRVAGMTAFGRVGVPDDIGPRIASLLSEDNRWVNAQRIEVSGGTKL